MRQTSLALTLGILLISVCIVPVARNFSASAESLVDSDYVLVGGQNGTWFKPGQAPRLERIILGNYSVTPLAPMSGQGTVWGGGWNGSQWLISGWGEDEGPAGSNPYIFLYDGRAQILGSSTDQFDAESTWHGGDIFAASYNGKAWLLSGLGSGNLASYGPNNHMSLSLFDGDTFTDLSASIPQQKDAILYANAWNGRYWLVGGGYGDDGVLLSFDGTKIVNLTNQIAQFVPSFSSVQSIAWNGTLWLIGGVNFLALYDGTTFTDLTDKLYAKLAISNDCCSSVNAIGWDGVRWLLGGGAPIAQYGTGQFWVVEYAENHFTDLTPQLSLTSAELTSYSGALSITTVDGTWVIGGYLRHHGALYAFSGNRFTNLSYLVRNFTYVNWVGASTLRTQISSTSHSSAQPESNFLPDLLRDLKFWPLRSIPFQAIRRP